MCQHIDMIQCQSMSLTEANLRLHSIAQHPTAQLPQLPSHTLSPRTHYHNSDLSHSEDGDSDVGVDTMALRNAASLEALQAYGGCFASGFLAMQNPLPWATAKPRRSLRSRRRGNNLEIWTSTLGMESVDAGGLTTGSSCSSQDTGNPRPDSDTLSDMGARDGATRKWLRSMNWRGSSGAKLPKSKSPVA